MKESKKCVFSKSESLEMFFFYKGEKNNKKSILKNSQIEKNIYLKVNRSFKTYNSYVDTNNNLFFMC